MYNKINYRSLIPLWVIGIFYILPLIINNSQYYDDIGRSVYGYFSWGIDGRPLSDLIFKTLDLGSPATDISPFPQIISILIMSSLCYLMHIYLNPSHKYGWLVFTPIFLSPFFIQNLSFRFDSLTMALSAAIAAVPLFYMRAGRCKIFLASFLCVFISLSLYQASLSVFISVICLYVLFAIKNNEDQYSLVVKVTIASVGMVVGYLAYTTIIVPAFVTSDYANGYNQIIDSFGELKENIKITCDVLSTFYTGTIAKIYNVVFLLATLGLIALILRVYQYRNITFKTSISYILIPLCLLTLLFCIPGPGLALKSMPIGPRVFIGFGFFISSTFALISFISTKHQNKLNIIYCVVLIASFSYMGTFANAMKSQDRLAERIIIGVTNDIVKIGFKDVKTITIDGKALYTPIADKAIQKSPLYRQMIPSYFDGYLAWGIVKMNEIYSGREQPIPSRQVEIISQLCDMQLITDAGLYKTYFRNGDLVVSFAFRDCSKR